MAFDVIYPHDRFVCNHRNRLCEAYAYQKRSNQSGTLGDSNAVDLGYLDPCISQRACHYRGDAIEIPPRRKLGYDTAVRSVDRDLRRNNVRANNSTALD